MVFCEHKMESVWYLSIIEETQVIVESIEDDVWEAEDEKLVSWLTDLIVVIDYAFKYNRCLFLWWVMDKNKNNSKW